MRVKFTPYPKAEKEARSISKKVFSLWMAKDWKNLDKLTAKTWQWTCEEAKKKVAAHAHEGLDFNVDPTYAEARKRGQEMEKFNLKMKELPNAMPHISDYKIQEIIFSSEVMFDVKARVVIEGIQMKYIVRFLKEKEAGKGDVNGTWGFYPASVRQL